MSQKEKNSSLSLLKKGSYLHKEEQQSLQKEPGVIPAPHPFLKGFEQSEFAEDRWWLLNMQYFVPDLSFPLYTDTYTLKPSRRKSAFTPALHLTKIFWMHSSAWGWAAACRRAAGASGSWKKSLPLRSAGGQGGSSVRGRQCGAIPASGGAELSLRPLCRHKEGHRPSVSHGLK